MMAPDTGSLIFGGVVIWGIYRRIRRNIGQQKLRPGRIIFSIVVFALMSTILLIFTSSQMPLLAGIGGGLVLGAILGFLGLKLTQFVTTEAGHYYTPNTHIGIALSVFFAGRILYNYWIRSQPSVASDHPQVFQSPLTLLIFGLVAGYYLVYYIGLFVHTHDRQPDAPPLPPAV